MLGTFADLQSGGDHDICIVGAGAAGLVLADALSGKGLRVLLLEAGGAKRLKASQDFYRGEILDPTIHPWIDRYRVRALGGTTTIWGGRAIPFDPIDFEARDWAPGSGWPFGYEALAPYYPEALERTDAGRFLFDPASALPGSQSELAPGLDGELIRTTIERFSKPTNFWRKYGDALTRSADVRVCPNAAVTGIRLHPDGRKVDHLQVAGPAGETVRLRAGAYVLALGGLETARLMLASNDLRPAGVGNEHGHLGRNYMSHLCTTEGVVTFAGPASGVAYDYERDADGVYLRRRLWITERAQRERRLLNTTFRTHLPEPGDPSHRDAILSAMFLVKDMVLYEYARKFAENPVTLPQRLRHVANVVTQPFRLAGFGLGWTRDRILAERKRPSVVLGSSQNQYVVEFHAEQAPNPNSRVSLSDERDAHGVPRLKVDWGVTPVDLESLRGCYELLASELARTGVGRLAYDPERLVAKACKNGIVGGHHIGTARMSVRPEDGVVDPDCRVHGVDNLYVASAAVFPSSGQANPTLTLLALTLRLAERLAGRRLSAAA